MAKFCQSCGAQMDDNQQFCPNCGAPQNDGAAAQPVANGGTVPAGDQKSKIAAGLLGLFLGAWGIHNFYLGNTNRGIIQIIVTIVTCGVGGIWGFIEGIMILAGSINTDANGVPLKD